MPRFTHCHRLLRTSAVQTPRDVLTSLYYFRALDDRAPYQYVHDPPAGIAKENLGVQAYPVKIDDARGREIEFTLDNSGFQFITHVSEERQFDDEQCIRTTYYREIVELLKRATAAKRVHVFDHTIRTKQTEIGQRSPNRGPVERVHVDQTFDAALHRVRHELPDEADRLLQRRIRIVNVWRPIHHPVAHKPLAVSDWRSVDKEHDLVPVRLIYPDRESSSFSVRYNCAHRWYYLSNQTPDEVILIKCYDSAVDRARLAPHSAFVDSGSSPSAPHRHSIEVRCLVFDTE
ncbi:uncharacterized protein B0H18DRAFT_868366 [Fomitopsis serialis]|uniref:uncharacterized protein n=1 Tax=Fomitopsis serialis TaxID=139415 RepID=UPI002007D3EA|nr:uncharacterized protein B0H18DRAFT_868366 [Neoantrodia serialis]KAH9936623.1 hypothetical protein B0H18DRAFT_868366 [Neoantrodia serialis]